MKKNSVIIISIYKNDTLPIVDEMFQSLFTQSSQVFDIFVQEDGILDPALESYLDTLYAEKKIMSLSKRQENRGLAYSLNELIERVLPLGYRYVFRMDSDDVSVENRIEKQINFLEAHPDIQALGGWIEEFNMDTGEIQVVHYGETHEELKNNSMKRNPLAHVTICFRSSFFDTIQSYDTNKLNEDLDLWVRAFKKDVKLHNLQEVLVRVRTNNAFFARRRNIKRAIEVMQLKFEATRTFGFGIKGYLYAMAHFILFMSPSWLKRYLYKNMRG